MFACNGIRLNAETVVPGQIEPKSNFENPSLFLVCLDAGRKVAIDASMSLYQFLIAIRQDGNVLMNEEGEVTSHLNGMFYRTIRLIENGIKPIWVFDGKPPELKAHEVSFL